MICLNSGFLRKCADTSNGADQIEKAVRLANHIGTSPTGERLSNISAEVRPLILKENAIKLLGLDM